MRGRKRARPERERSVGWGRYNWAAKTQDKKKLIMEGDKTREPEEISTAQYQKEATRNTEGQQFRYDLLQELIAELLQVPFC